MSRYDDLLELSHAELQDEAEDRGIPKYGTKAEIAERIVEHDEADASDSEDDADASPSETSDDEAPAADDEVGVPDDDPKPIRAGGYVDHRDGKGWQLDDRSVDRGSPDPRDHPVDPGSAGLPGNPAMKTAFGAVPEQRESDG